MSNATIHLVALVATLVVPMSSPGSCMLPNGSAIEIVRDVYRDRQGRVYVERCTLRSARGYVQSLDMESCQIGEASVMSEPSDSVGANSISQIAAPATSSSPLDETDPVIQGMIVRRRLESPRR